MYFLESENPENFRKINMITWMKIFSKTIRDPGRKPYLFTVNVVHVFYFPGFISNRRAVDSPRCCNGERPSTPFWPIFIQRPCD